eukprot:1158506-Pelagomonas_calceolata.AAC.1
MPAHIWTPLCTLGALAAHHEKGTRYKVRHTHTHTHTQTGFLTLTGITTGALSAKSLATALRISSRSCNMKVELDGYASVLACGHGSSKHICQQGRTSCLSGRVHKGHADVQK